MLRKPYLRRPRQLPDWQPEVCTLRAEAAFERLPSAASEGGSGAVGSEARSGI